VFFETENLAGAGKSLSDLQPSFSIVPGVCYPRGREDLIRISPSL